ncbi:hypothetical protein AMJ86_03735 [bacterium SM23_57]|nr:MAG: hypothetical protein AMJ86_03735 [bacterium SM23_57]
MSGIRWGILLIVAMTTVAHADYSATPLKDSTTANTKDSWWSNDKITHAVVGFSLAGFSTGIAKYAFDNSREGSVIIGISIPVSFGLFKEWYDWKHPETHQASYKDLVAGFIGAAIGTALVIALSP